jgi:peptide/nickel transport system substrate-binding protein
MKHDKLSLIASAVAISLFAFSPSAYGQAQDKDTVIVGIFDDITSLNPLRGQNTQDQLILRENVFDIHLEIDRETFDVIPHVFTEWTTNEDGTEWTVKVRDDIVFHNGDKLTAEDVKFSIEYILKDPGGQLYNMWERVTEMEIKSPTELVIKSDLPNPMLMSLAELAIIPKKYFEEVGEEAFNEKPIGSGPYKFVEWRRGEQLELEAFDDYWGGKPAIKHAIFRLLPDEASRSAAYRAGEVDIAQTLALEQYQAIEAMNDPNLGTAVINRGRIYGVFDVHRKPFDDVRVRKAFNHAIDWDTIIAELMNGLATRSNSILTSNEFGHNPDLKPYAYDPELSKKLLAEAGYPDGVDIDLWARQGYTAIDTVAQALKPYLDAVGFRTNLTIMDRSDMNKIYEDAHDQMENGVPAPLVPDVGLSGWYTNATNIGTEFYQGRSTCHVENYNYPWGGFYCSKENDQLVEQALDVWATDIETAEALTQQMEKNTYDDAGFAFAYGLPQIFGKDKRLNWVMIPSMSLNMSHVSWQ